MYLKTVLQFIYTALFSLLMISLSAQPEECFDFSNLEIDQKIGLDSGNRPGDEIDLLPNSDVKVTLETFSYVNGGEPGFWNIDVVDWDFYTWEGVAPYLFLGNINMVYDFTTLPNIVTQVSFDFVDGGGEHNIRINGDTLYNFGEFKELPREIAPDVLLTVSGNKLYLEGNIKELLLGGQEFGFDNFCYTVSDVAPLCIDDIVVRSLPCTINGFFYAEISFDANNPPSDSFIISGNDQLYGPFPYGQTSYEVGPIQGDSINFEFIITDVLDPNCTNFKVIDPVLCEDSSSVCLIYDLWAQSGLCHPDGAQELYFNFSKENAHPTAFDVFIDQEFVDFFRYEEGADSIGYVLPNLDLTAGMHILTVCSNEDADCCKTIEFLAATCQDSLDCPLLSVEKTFISCNENASYYMEFDVRQNNLGGELLPYTVSIDGVEQEHVPITDNKFKIEAAQLEVGLHSLSLCYASDLTECCTTLNFETIDCNTNEFSCSINSLIAEPSTCKENGSFGLEFTTEVDLIDDSLLVVKIDDEFLTYIPIRSDGNYRIEELVYPAGTHRLTVCSLINDDCCKTTEFNAPECAELGTECEIVDVFAEAHPCDSSGYFYVDISFMAMNQRSEQFEILGNAITNSYGTFHYGEPFYTVGPIKGDGETTYEFIIRDLEDHDCKGFAVLAPISCGFDNSDCSIENLRHEVSECRTDGTVDIEIQFDNQLDNDRGFNVYLDEEYVETYGYHQNPFVLSKVNLAAGVHTLMICRNDLEDCCIRDTIIIPECGTCTITNVTAIASDCETEEFFFVDLKFDVDNPSSDKFRVIGNSNLYGIFEYGEERYRLGPLDGDGSTMYEFIVQDIKNETCASFAELEKTIDCDEGFVWPGDANSDNISDNFDLLSIGLAYGKTGPERILEEPIDSFSAILWERQAAADWDFRFKNGVNGKHADCNGDGIVNEGDLRAINENYFLTHGPVQDKILSEGSQNDPALYVELPSLNNIEVGQETVLPIIFGNNDIPAEAYGLAFTLQFDPRLIKDGRIEFSESWLGTPEQDLMIINQNFNSDGLLEVALTRKDGNLMTGAGVIGQFIVIIDDIEGYNGEGSIAFQNVQLIDNEGDVLRVHTPKTQFSAITQTDEVGKAVDIALFPNPANDYISIRYDLEKELQGIEISTISGSFIKHISINQLDNIDVSGLLDGVYLIKIKSGGQSVYKKFVKQ